MAISFYNLTLKFVWIPDSVVRNTLLCKCLHYKNMLHKSFSLKGFLFFFAFHIPKPLNINISQTHFSRRQA